MSTIFTFHNIEITGEDTPIGFCYDLGPLAKGLEITVQQLKQAIFDTNSELHQERVLYTDLSDALFWLTEKHDNDRADELIRQLVTDALYA
ncbi:hypothetical protein [Laspinema olomoucense]|uniref:Uncharacterized protein n=1 Tax=Laspinema olomoucense D3b TaxID=2953688 RepID=A0ABT2N4G3_9CYAN|nr:hypothetical protein [Laspinema sp. D3b]MCT7977573.1 hypothetical protein [Laspinema sp. D3b]